MRIPQDDRQGRTGLEMTMTPMIDVIFLMQIFFLCTAGFELPESILPAEFSLSDPVPASLVTESPDLESVHIRLTSRSGELRIEMNRRRVENVGRLIGDLRRIGKIAPQLPVILDVAPEVLLGDVVAVYDGCLNAALRNVHFATGSGEDEG